MRKVSGGQSRKSKQRPHSPHPPGKNNHHPSDGDKKPSVARGTSLVIGTEPKGSAEVATQGDWKLIELPRLSQGPTAHEYRNFKLVAITPQRKANFWLPYHSPRSLFMETKDDKLLAKHLPALRAWAREVALAHMRRVESPPS